MREKKQGNTLDEMFNKITENVPKLRKDTPIPIQEAHKTPNRPVWKENYHDRF